MKRNRIIILLTLILSIFGILMIYSSSNVISMYKFNNPYKYVFNQIIFFIIGIILMLFISKIDYKNYYKYSNIILLISIILLILVLIPGIGVIRNGSRSWFSLFSFGFQPSELSKIALIIFVSKYLSKYEEDMKNIISYSIPILLIIFFIFALIMLEPDFGTGMIIVLSLIVLIFASNIKISFFIYLGIIGLIGIVILILIAPYRLERIISFLNPWSDPLGSGFQIIQSLYSIGPGGLFGVGFNNSIQKNFYLPEPQTDFIFAIILEELGFISIIIISIIYIILFYNILKISLSSKDKFAKYLSLGLMLELVLQTILNLLVVVGLIPVTGVTLPFISYGGSSLITCMISIGIILNICKNK